MAKLTIIDTIRSILAKIWQRTELIIKIGLKFLAYYYMFRMLAGAEMFAHLPETFLIHSRSIQLVLALVSTLLPNRSGVLLALLLIVYSVFQTSLIGAILVGLALLLLYAAASSLFPEQVYLVPLMVVSIHYHFYLALPLFCGMYLGATTIVPLLIGIVTYAVLQIIPQFMFLQMGALDTLPQLISDASTSGLSSLMDNRHVVYLMVVCSIIVLLGTLLCRMKFNFGRYIALGVSGIFGMIAFMTGASSGRIPGSPVSILTTSLIVLAVFLFFELLKVSLSYEGSQSLEFEDDNYVYQVRMIPKMSKHHTVGEESDLIIRKAPEKGKKGKKAAKAAAAVAVAAGRKGQPKPQGEADRAFSEEDLTSLSGRSDRISIIGESETTPSRVMRPVEDDTPILLPGDEEYPAEATQETIVAGPLAEEKTQVVPEDEELEQTKILQDTAELFDDDVPYEGTEDQAEADTNEVDPLGMTGGTKVVSDTAGIPVRNVLSDEEEPMDLFEDYDEKHS